MLDPRWEWVEVVDMRNPGPEYVRGACRHLELEPVTALDGRHVAYLCRTCDQQLTLEHSQ